MVTRVLIEYALFHNECILSSYRRFHSYGSSNQLMQIVDQTGTVQDSYIYDAAGNRVQMSTPNGNTFYSYDERNLLISVLTPTDNINYTYNGIAQRVSRMIDGVNTNYMIDPTRSSRN